MEITTTTATDHAPCHNKNCATCDAAGLDLYIDDLGYQFWYDAARVWVGADDSMMAGNCVAATMLHEKALADLADTVGPCYFRGDFVLEYAAAQTEDACKFFHNAVGYAARRAYFRDVKAGRR